MTSGTDRLQTDYPSGDGHVDCPYCKGRGVVLLPQEERKPWVIGEATKPCVCTIRRDQNLNLRRAWQSAASSRPFKDTPLTNFCDRNLRIRTDLVLFRRHLATLAFHRPPRWSFKVITDVDLMTSWLYSANEVFDGDVGLSRLRGENQSSRLTDLVEPWDLVIFRLGVKTARNSATPEVLLEALYHRDQMGLPTWVADDPQKPFKEGHLAWSYEAGTFLEEWDFLDLIGNTTRKMRTISGPPAARPNLSASLVRHGGIQEIQIPSEEEEEGEEPEEPEDDLFSRVVFSDPEGAKKKKGKGKRR